MEMKMKNLVLVAGCLIALAGCADSQRWQSEEYQPNMTGDIWAPRADWKASEARAKKDWQNALEDLNADCTVDCE